MKNLLIKNDHDLRGGTGGGFGEAALSGNEKGFGFGVPELLSGLGCGCLGVELLFAFAIFKPPFFYVIILRVWMKSC